jgi:YfiH family protein
VKKAIPTKRATKKPLEILRAGNLSKLLWLVHGFSTRSGGSSRVYGTSALNLGFTKEDARSAVERNRQAFIQALGATTGKTRWPLVTPRQIHSDLIYQVSEPSSRQLVGDGLITNTPELLLGIQTADCYPIMLVDTKHKAVGVFHAGWRGTVKRIAEKGAGAMRLHFGSLPRNLKAAIGPGIGGCCYEVGEEVRTQFESQFEYAPALFREIQESDPVREKYPLLFLTARAPGHSVLPTKIFLDLAEANRRQLLDIGVLAKNISISGLCTACNNDRLFSYRAEHGRTGRMIAAVGIRKAGVRKTWEKNS